MADVTELTPAHARRGNSSSRSSRNNESLEDQLSRLQDDMKAITASLARLSEEKVSEARSSAKAQYKGLVKSGQHVVDDLGDQATAFEKQITDTIREKPLTAVAGAIGVGFLIALLSRR